MPIRKDLRRFYGPEWRKQIRPRILARAENRCEFCAKPNHAAVRQIVEPGKRMFWLEWAMRTGAYVVRTHFGAHYRGAEIDFNNSYEVRVVLTVAHLNHDPSDNRDGNLAALCQWCHLNHDREHHAETRAARKDAARPILAAAREESTYAQFHR